MRFPFAGVVLSFLVACSVGTISGGIPSTGGPESTSGDLDPPTDAGGDGDARADGGDRLPSDEASPPADPCTCIESNGDHDAVVIVDASLPDTLSVGHAAVGRITVANVGTSTWTAAGNYMLGAIDNSDPFNDEGRVPLPEGARICGSAACPGTHTFEVPLVAPRPPGQYVTDWGMLVERGHWFGDAVTRTITVDAGVCGDPVPPPLARFNIKPHNAVWDSTAIVYGRYYNGGEENFCELIGFTDQRIFCPPRPEGHPEVYACELFVVGTAIDTGAVGPTWTMEDALCGTPGAVGCENTANQFQVKAYGPGTLEACGNVNGVCTEVEVP
jgi:hypothetical protein